MLIHSSLCVLNFMSDNFLRKFLAPRERFSRPVLANSTVRLTKQKNGQPNNLVWFPEEAPDSSLLLTVQTASGTPPCHKLNRHQGSFPWQQGERGVKLTTTQHLVPKLRMNGVTSRHAYSFVVCRNTALPSLYSIMSTFKIWVIMQ